MFDNITLVALIIIVFWIGSFVLYLFYSKQQAAIQEDIDQVKDLLNQSKKRL